MSQNNNDKRTIKSWALDERPREKLLQHGATTLSNAELLAILIGTGSGAKTAIDLARDLLQITKNDLASFSQLSIKQLEQIKGIGEAKAISIVAAIEFGKRIQSSSFNQHVSVSNINDTAAYLINQFGSYPHEVFAVLFLNNANKILNTEIISEGGYQGTIVDSRIIFKLALLCNATQIILCHNHPSGKVNPSQSDIKITAQIKEAANFLDIRLLDHIIVSKEQFYSFANEGLI
jgi:DNA repair protein RadC